MWRRFVELFGVGLVPDESALTDEILRGEKLTPEVAKLTQFLGGAGIGAQWSPIYGKIEIFDSALGNFSFFVGAGIGVGVDAVNKYKAQDQFCPNNTCGGEPASIRRSAGTQADASTAIVVVGSALAVAGLVVVLSLLGLVGPVAAGAAAPHLWLRCAHACVHMLWS